MTLASFSPHTTTVADIAASRPRSLRLFHRYGIDFCCGGKRPLADACAASGVSTEQLLTELAVLEAEGAGDVRWDEAPLAALVDHIVERHHRPLDEELPRLEAMARRVAHVHGYKRPELLPPLQDAVLALIDELQPHLQHEETVLFPAIRAGQGADVTGPVAAALREDHLAVAALLVRLRDLTEGFVPPPEACGTWRGLYQGLKELDEDLREHIHLENNVLFPRATTTPSA